MDLKPDDDLPIAGRTGNQALGVGLAGIDDGHGMSEPDLIEAMRPGSRNPRDTRSKDDLGRFGLGLKTASFSQCRCLTVVSRKDGITTARRWDLDEVNRRNEWFLIEPAELMRGEKYERNHDLEVVGFYHSHPDHPARPSQYDLDHAWPFFSYVIVSVMGGEDQLLTSWRLKDDRSAFDEESTEIRN